MAVFKVGFKFTLPNLNTITSQVFEREAVSESAAKLKLAEELATHKRMIVEDGGGSVYIISNTLLEQSVIEVYMAG